MSLPDEMNTSRREYLKAQITETKKRIAAMDLTRREFEHELNRIPSFEGVESAGCAERIQQ